MTFRRKVVPAGLALFVGVAGFAVAGESSAFAALPSKRISICLNTKYKAGMEVRARISGFNENNIWVNTKWMQAAIGRGGCGVWNNSLWKTGQHVNIRYDILGIKNGDFSCKVDAKAPDPVPCMIP